MGVRCRSKNGRAVRAAIMGQREKVSAFSLFYFRLSEVVKTMGLLCRKVTLKCFCYVTLGLAACSVDL